MSTFLAQNLRIVLPVVFVLLVCLAGSARSVGVSVNPDTPQDFKADKQDVGPNAVPAHAFSETTPFKVDIGLTPEEEAVLAATPEIVLGAATEYPPLVFEKADGTYGGMLVDLFEQLNRRLANKLRLHVGTPWYQVQQQAIRGEIDGLAMGGRDAKREVDFDPTATFLQTYFSVFARTQNEHRVTRFSDLDGLRIGYKKGARATRSLLEKLPTATLTPYGSHEAMTQALLGREIDVIVAWFSYDFWRKERLQGTVDNIFLIDEYPMEMVTHIRKARSELIPILNKAIADIRYAELPSIINKWFGQSSQTGGVEGVALTVEEKAWIKSHPRIVLGTDADWRPWVIPRLDGSVGGVEGALISRINQLTGLNLQIKLGKWSEILEQERAGEIDGLLLSTAQKERQAHFLFTESSFNAFKYLYALRGAIGPSSMDDLHGRKVAYQHGNLFEEKLLKNYPEVEAVAAANNDQKLTLLLTGEVDAILSGITFQHFLAERIIKDVGLTFVVPDSELQLLYSIRNDWPQLVSIINKALSAIPQGERLAMLQQWGLSAPNQMATPALLAQMTPEEISWINERGAIDMCVDPNWMPFEQINTEGDYEGMVADYMETISDRIGLRFRVVPTQTFSQSIQYLADARCLLLSSWAPMEGRAAPGLPSDAYLTLSDVLAVRTDVSLLSEHDSLAGLRIGAVAAYPTQAKISRRYPEAELVLVADIDEGIRKLSNGELDAFAASQSAIGFAIQKLQVKNVKLGGVVAGEEQVRMVVNSDVPMLLSILNKAIASIEQKDRQRLASKWFAVTTQRETDYTLLRTILIGFLLLLGAVLVWVFAIQRQKQVLATSEARLRLSEKRLRLTNAELLNAKELAEAASRSKTSFLANISHELRTPLNAILGFSRRLAQESSTTVDQREKLSVINRSGENLLTTINELLDLSKVEAGRETLRPELFDLHRLLEEVCGLFRLRAEQLELEFSVDFDPGLPRFANADAGKIRRILSNLLSNALKFTQRGGIRVRAEHQMIPDDAAAFLLRLEVEDSGEGISSDDSNRVFEAFYQVERPDAGTKGTGLGLAISKSYAELMGGRIWVESTPGKGSRFRVDLPIALGGAIADAADPAPEVQAYRLAPDQPAWRILVVEDNDENRTLLSSLLDEAGFDVRDVTDGEQAISQFRQWRPHLIWMDMRMPVMDGYEATRSIRSLPDGRVVKIVAITASAFDDQRTKILAIGCDEVVNKPFQDVEIFDAMKRLLGVEYQHKHPSSLAARSDGHALTAEMLGALPAVLRIELSEAILALDMEGIAGVIRRIGVLAPETAQHLEGLVQEFQLAHIRELLQDVEEAHDAGEFADRKRR